VYTSRFLGINDKCIGRRYLRLFSFIDCFERVRGLLVEDFPLGGALFTTMELVESSCLGLYLLLENMTMVLHLFPPRPFPAMSVFVLTENQVTRYECLAGFVVHTRSD
jgi:hypothetical protein